jgi:bifunctional DNase/RNase
MGKVKLNVLGISYSQTQSGAYALVLSEADGERRIPIIIGGFEAQAIAIQLEGLTPPRPLTHDLFVHLSNKFNIKLTEVNIYKLEEGVFFSKLICSGNDKIETIDARTSDAVALALRYHCPVFTTEEIVERAGIILDTDPPKEPTKFEDDIDEPEDYEDAVKGSLKEASVEELEKMLNEAINDENYEFATRVRDELDKRKK